MGANPMTKGRVVVAMVVAALISTAATAPAGAEQTDASVAGDRCFIDAAHRLFIDRPANGAEIRAWETRSDSGEPRYRLPTSLAGSEEWLSGVVVALYQEVLGRPADAAGRAHWIDRLAVVNDVRLAVDLASSAEFARQAADGCPTITRIADADDTSIGSSSPGLSADGRHIAFWADASDLVPGDTNGQADIFTLDRTTGALIRITDSGNGSHVDGPVLSADGRHIAFSSPASNLVPGDTNGRADIFTWDRSTGTTTRITAGNVSTGGRHGPDLGRGPRGSPADHRRPAGACAWSELCDRGRRSLIGVDRRGRVLTRGSTV